MSLTAIKERVAKLLALAESSNENESALAIAKAQRLILEYKLSIAECKIAGNDDCTESVVADAVPLIRSNKIALWQGVLCMALCYHNDCKVLKRAGYGLMIYGKPSDVMTVRVMLAHVISELWRLSPKGCGRVYSDSWYLGAIRTIKLRLDEMRTEVVKTATTYGLVKLNKPMEAVESFINSNIKVTKGSTSQATIDGNAYNHGMADGNKVKLSTDKTLS